MLMGEIEDTSRKIDANPRGRNSRTFSTTRMG
jgi:hypothetical protein